MTGSTFRRCGCRDEQGKQFGQQFPQLGSKGHGSWWYAIALPAGPDGKRKQQRRGGFATKRAAQEAADKQHGRAAGGQVVDDKEPSAPGLRRGCSASGRCGLPLSAATKRTSAST